MLGEGCSIIPAIPARRQPAVNPEEPSDRPKGAGILQNTSLCVSWEKAHDSKGLRSCPRLEAMMETRGSDGERVDEKLGKHRHLMVAGRVGTWREERGKGVSPVTPSTVEWIVPCLAQVPGPRGKAEGDFAAAVGGGCEWGEQGTWGFEIRRSWEGLSTNQHVGLGGWFRRG